MGCTVAPDFDYADYEHGRRDELVALWPDQADAIAVLTPVDPAVKPTASPDSR